MRCYVLTAILGCLFLFWGCSPTPEDTEYVLTYEPSYEDFANPERGFKMCIYFEHAPFPNKVNPSALAFDRKQRNITLRQHVYYLMDFMESDISQEYLDALDANMQGLRDAGCKCILRFGYCYDEFAPLDQMGANYKWVKRHVEQLKPYLIKNEDVIFCMEAGFLGPWGEWGPSPDFPGYDGTEESFKTRVELLDWLMDALPASRQIAVRTPYYKRMYLRMSNLPVKSLDSSLAHSGAAQARIAGHNDCFISSENDVGTYFSSADRVFWANDTRYTVMGGEICYDCIYSIGDHAIDEMERFHFTYLNDGEWNDIRKKWELSGHWDAVCRRMGYRLVLDKSTLRSELQNGFFSINVTLHNEGFAAPQNPRAVELIMVGDNATYVFPQEGIDPRFWLPSNPISIDLRADMSDKPKGKYKIYLNLPDPSPSLHNNPAYSIRLANKSVWKQSAGYNRLGTVTIQ